MAGIQTEINHNGGEILERLNELLTRVDDPSPAMAEISEYLHLQTRKRFDTETAPDGTAWAPLKPATVEAKQKDGVPIHRILHGKGLLLRDTIFPFYDRTEAGVSTAPATSAYAAAHQFGTEGESISVPAHNRRVTHAFGNELPFPVWASVGAYSFTGNTPARPYMGMGEADEDYVLEILGGFLALA